MVTWIDDGFLASSWRNTAVSPPRYVYSVFGSRFAMSTPGTVDLNATTRLQYFVDRWNKVPGYTGDGYNGRGLDAQAGYNFTAGDVIAGRTLTASLFIVPASAFSAGVVPTISQIFNSPQVRVFRYTGGRTTAGDLQPYIYGPKPNELTAGTKYWAMLAPTRVANMSSAPSPANDPIVGGYANGKALSFWTNRTPLSPIITSPASGTVVAAGGTATFSFSTRDPDAITRFSGDVDPNIFDDLAGVQVQYAPRPTTANPSPAWIDMPIGRTAPGYTNPGRGWFIERSTTETADDGAKALWTNRTMTIRCGSNTISQGMGALPSGDWQIRIRTFDYGHPEPAVYGPLGLTDTGYYTPYLPASKYNYNPSTYPAANTSPWSEPVQITVTAQVPPAKPIRPTGDIALVENIPVALEWQYRNTHIPPFAQAARTVQIRKVGDAAWSTVARGSGSAPSITLAPVNTATPGNIVEYLPNPGFETNNTDSWTYRFGGSGAGVANVSNPANAHSGNRFLETTATTPGDVSRGVTLDPTHTKFQFTAWYQPRLTYSQVAASILFFDSGGNPLTAPTSPAVLRPVAGASTGLWPSYVFLDTGVVDKPAGAVSALVIVQPSNRDFTGTNYSGERLDDVSFRGAPGPFAYPTDAFTLSATNEYEWQVQTTDTDNVTSNFSTIARFWIVPAPNSGGGGVVPSGTIEGATLGCGTYEAWVYRRGGRDRVGQITGITYLDWARVRDDISTSKIVTQNWDVDCGNLLSMLDPWAYEIVLFRNNGYSIDRVWEGPITLLTYERGKVTIQAKDMMGYAYRRILKQAMNDSKTTPSVTVTARATQVMLNVFAPDDPNILANLVTISADDDAVQKRNVPAYARTAYEEIDDMASNAGLDYTCIGRSVLLWGTKNRIGTLPEFRDEDLGASPIVSVYGMSMANRYVISDGNGAWGEANRLDSFGRDERNGLVEMLSSSWASDSDDEQGTYTQAGLESVRASYAGFAERAIADRNPAPVIVRVPDNTSLNPDATISVQQLVPGVVIPLRSVGTLRTVGANQKLDSLRCVWQAPKGETLTITMSPFSDSDAEADEGEEG